MTLDGSDGPLDFDDNSANMGAHYHSWIDGNLLAFGLVSFQNGFAEVWAGGVGTVFTSSIALHQGVQIRNNMGAACGGLGAQGPTFVSGRVVIEGNVAYSRNPRLPWNVVGGFGGGVDCRYGRLCLLHLLRIDRYTHCTPAGHTDAPVLPDFSDSAPVRVNPLTVHTLEIDLGGASVFPPFPHERRVCHDISINACMRDCTAHGPNLTATSS